MKFNSICWRVVVLGETDVKHEWSFANLLQNCSGVKLSVLNWTEISLRSKISMTIGLIRYWEIYVKVLFSITHFFLEFHDSVEDIETTELTGECERTETSLIEYRQISFFLGVSHGIAQHRLKSNIVKLELWVFDRSIDKSFFLSFFFICLFEIKQRKLITWS